MKREANATVAIFPLSVRVRTALAAFAAGCVLAAPAAARAENYRAVVVGVVYGDLLKVTRVDTGGQEMVKIYGVDCPKNGQPYSREAKEFTESLAADQVVIVDAVLRSRRSHVDANITLSDGTRLGANILKDGWAWWDRSRAPENDFYQALEHQARVRRIGLWQDRNPIPPWEWHPYHKHHPRPSSPSEE